MTCIVALVDKDTVYMGGDSSTSMGDRRMFVKRDKVNKRGEFVLASAGYTRANQIFMYGWLIPKCDKNRDEYEYMLNEFVPALKNVLIKEGQVHRNEGIDEMYNTFLVGFRGRLFMIGLDFAVDEAEECYDAIGNGADYALAVMHSTEKMDLKPMDRLKLALDTASRFSVKVCPPYVFESTEPVDDPVDIVVDTIVDKANEMMGNED